MAQSSFARPEQRPSALTSLTKPPRPVEPELTSVGMSLSGPSPNIAEAFGDLQTTAVHGTPHPTDNLIRPRQHALLDWYSSPEPWNPITGRNPSAPRTGARLNSRHSGVSFHPYRQYAPSECDTTGPTDSGYGTASRTGQSVANGSIYGDCDRSGETASVASHPVTFPYDRSMGASDTWRLPGPTLGTDASGNVDSSRLVCPHCHNEVKTKSELKKHKQKHEKPHRCRVPGCTRKEGFSTPNDVERHVRSRHPGSDPDGKYYRCTEPDCRSKDKNWPRADNFRQHLKRVHHITLEDVDLEKYVYKPQPSPGLDLAGLGSSVGDPFISPEIHNGGTILTSDPWPLGLQAVAEGDSHPFNDYMDHQMFQDDVIADQQLGVMPSTATADQNSSTMVEMHRVEFDADTALPRSEERPIDPQEHLDLASPSDGHHSIDFQPNFFNEASIPENESLGEDDESNMQHMTHLSPPDAFRELSTDLAQTRQSMIETTIDPMVGDLQDDPIEVGHDDSSCTPTPSTSSTPGSDDLSQNPPVENTSQPEQPTLTQAPSGSGTQDKEKASDLLQVLGDKELLTEILSKLDKGTLAEALEHSGYERPKEAEVKTKPSPAPSAPADTSKHTYVCTKDGCAKAFGRQCELKKHMKRHAKPYGCTFPCCEKRFGSKNDWKRHENSQHYQPELWKCNEKSLVDPNESCGMAFNRREQFKTHLSENHGIVDCAAVESKLEEDSRSYEVTFWCGFCRQTITRKEKGLKAWVSRFDHIGKHFANELDISQWKPGGSDINFVLSGDDEASKSKVSDSVYAPAAVADGSGRSLKRRDHGETQQSRAQKKACPGTMWFCCGCGEQILSGFSIVCLSPGCRGHEQCENCKVDVIQLHPEA